LLTAKDALAFTAAVSPIAKSEFRSDIERQSGQKILQCYQCGKCTAGCPVSYSMDLGPRRVIRAIQLGLKDEALSSSTIWLCFFCYTCSARCPREIDIARVMESLRLMAVSEGVKPAEKDIELFHRLFLDNVRRWGRIHELGLAGSYNLFSRHFLANVGLLPGMVSRSKLAILPPRIRATAQVKAIFAKAGQRKSKQRVGKS